MKKVLNILAFVIAMFVLSYAKADNPTKVQTRNYEPSKIDTIADFVGYDYSVTVYSRGGDYYINEVVLDSSLGEILIAHDFTQLQTSIRHIAYFVNDTTSDDLGFHSAQDIYLHLERGEDNPSGDDLDEQGARNLAWELGLTSDTDMDMGDLYDQEELSPTAPIITDGSGKYSELPAYLIMQLAQ